MTEPGAPRDLTESEPNVGEESGLAGDMGVSSERVGKARGEAEPTTSGTETLEFEAPVDPPPEQEAN